MSITVEEAREKVLSKCRLQEMVKVPIMDSLFLVSADDIRSDIDISPFDNSAMDGFAVRAASVADASESGPVTLSVISYVAAGDYSALEVGLDQAARIMTGAPMPPGADAVVMIENTEAGEKNAWAGGTVHILKSAVPGENVRFRGEEVKAGQVVVEKGSIIGPAGVGLLASAGHDKVSIYKPPKVAILSTGNELVEVTEKPGPGQIRNSNSYSVAAQVIAAGCVPLRMPIVPDDPEATRRAFLEAAEKSDFILATGGVSVGDMDFVRPVLEEIGELDFFKVRMRPGQPQTMGSIGKIPFFGLPGNPTSAYVGFEVFIRPALRMMCGHRNLERPETVAVIEHDVKKNPDRRYYYRGRLQKSADGGLSAGFTGNQSSALLTSAHRGNCFIVLPEGESFFPAGSKVRIMRLDMDEGTI